MCDLGINQENFNPSVLYAFKSRVNARSGCTFHSHDFTEFKYVLSGSCTYNIKGIIYNVKKGDIIVCSPGVLHSKLFAGNEEVAEFNVGLNNIFIDNLQKDFLIESEACPVITPFKHRQDFIKCCNEMLAEQARNEPGCGIVLKALVMKLIVIFLKETYYIEKSEEGHTISFESHEKSCIVETIISYMDENYMKDISLDRISKNMFLSPVYISRLFKEGTGDSPINYLIKIRLSKARDMLESGRISIKAAAELVGYHDVYHFSKLFKKHYGYPPSRLWERR